MLYDDLEFGPYDNAEQKARLAFEFYEDGKMTQALDELETAIEINPVSSSLHFNKALTLDSLGRFEEAIGEYETALQLNPEDLEILNSLAVDYTRTSQYDLAIETFEHIQELDSGFEPCYCNRIITYTEMGLHDMAEQMFYLAQQIRPECALCFYNIGNSLFARGQYKRAIRCWIRTAELEVSHPQIHYRIAQAFWSDGDVENSRKHFLEELRVNPGDIDVIFDFGLFLLEIGDVESAREKFHRILEINPDFAAALFYLGEIAFNNQDYERAVELYNQALEKDRTLQGPCYRLAQYSLMKGCKIETGAYLISEMKLPLEDAGTLVSMGSMFIEIDDLTQAMHCLMRAIETDGASADAYYYLGVVSALQDNCNNAAELFAHALDLRGDHIPTLRDSASVCLALGRLTDAAAKIEKARSLDGDNVQLKKIERSIVIARTKQRIKSALNRFKVGPADGKSPR